jgi:hypothetical protein
MTPCVPEHHCKIFRNYASVNKKPAPTFARAGYMQPPRFSEFIQRPQADYQIGATPTKHYSSPYALSRENRLCLVNFRRSARAAGSD